MDPYDLALLGHHASHGPGLTPVKPNSKRKASSRRKGLEREVRGWSFRCAIPKHSGASEQ